MTNQQITNKQINKSTNILVTGGAGFIGSNLVAALLNDPRVGTVRVLDNLSNGYLETSRALKTFPRP